MEGEQDDLNAAFLDMCAARRDFFRKLERWADLHHDELSVVVEFEGARAALKEIRAARWMKDR